MSEIAVFSFTLEPEVSSMCILKRADLLYYKSLSHIMAILRVVIDRYCSPLIKLFFFFWPFSTIMA